MEKPKTEFAEDRIKRRKTELEVLAMDAETRRMDADTRKGEADSRRRHRAAGLVLAFTIALAGVVLLLLGYDKTAASGLFAVAGTLLGLAFK